MSWENIQDYDAFTSAVQNELLKRVVDLENQQLVYGTGGTTQLSGLTTTAGILTYPAVGTQENFTDIATAIAALRTGPALAEPDLLLLLHPDTWAHHTLWPRRRAGVVDPAGRLRRRVRAVRLLEQHPPMDRGGTPEPRRRTARRDLLDHRVAHGTGNGHHHESGSQEVDRGVGWSALAVGRTPAPHKTSAG